MIKAEDVQKAINGRLIKGNINTIFSGISTDSRHIQKGNLFWALKGEKFDGHDFVLDAINAGASGVVIAEDHINNVLQKLRHVYESTIISVKDTLKGLGDIAGWWRMQHNVKVIAITGSSGKTTTKEMLFSILSINNKVLKSPGNYNNLIGLPLTLLGLNSSYDMVLLEMGMNRPGEISRLTQIANPEIGLITNIGPVHLQGVKNIYGVARAKAELAENISSEGVVFINGDNELLLKAVSQFKKQIIKFGKGLQNDIKLEKIFFNDISGSAFKLLWKGKSLNIRINIPGISNIMNALAASAVCLYMGETEENIKKGLLRYKGVKGRFEIIRLNNNNILINDTYNSNPLSLKVSIESIKNIRGKRSLIIGLGDMLELGNYSVYAHREAGRLIAELDPDFFIAMGSFSTDMIEGAKKAGMSEKRLFISCSHEEMAYEIEKRLKQECIVFLKGSRAMALEKVAEHIIKKAGLKEVDK